LLTYFLNDFEMVPVALINRLLLLLLLLRHMLECVLKYTST
jgi:hypothetical protein